MYPRGRELVENEEQEQEQEEGSESEGETGFVDLDPDALSIVLERVDVLTLGRAACVNKLWRRVAWYNRHWVPSHIRSLAGMGMLWYIDRFRTVIDMPSPRFRLQFRLGLSDIAKPPLDFYSIDFSKKIRPWVQNSRQNLFFIPHTEEVTHNRG